VGRPPPRTPAKVTYTDVLPDISVTKEADDSSFQAVGGQSVDNFTPTRRSHAAAGGGGGSGSFIFAGNTCDDAGANDEPAQSDLNCFSRADNVTGRLGAALDLGRHQLMDRHRPDR
jgi:hypothetical protein